MHQAGGGLACLLLLSSCCLGSDFKREVTCGRNQSLTVKSVHKLMTRVVGKLW